MMRTAFRRGCVAVLAVAGVAAGSLSAVAPADAARPGDLQITGGVGCDFDLGQWGQPWHEAWSVHRWLSVRNIGGSTMHNIRLQEVNGRTVHIRELRPGQSASRWDSRYHRWIHPIETRARGCYPVAIAGFTIGAERENLLNNAGFWHSLRRENNPPPRPRR